MFRKDVAQGRDEKPKETYTHNWAEPMAPQRRVRPGGTKEGHRVLGDSRPGWRGDAGNLEGARNVCRGLEGLEFKEQGSYAEGFRGGTGDFRR